MEIPEDFVETLFAFLFANSVSNDTGVVVLVPEFNPTLCARCPATFHPEVRQQKRLRTKCFVVFRLCLCLEFKFH